MEKANRRLAKNTLMLYFRQLAILGVSLFSVRVVLDALGTSDFGIFSVIGGLVALLSFLTGAMSGASQRFFSYALGTNDRNRLRATFSVNLVIYLLLVVVSVAILETLGLWFVQTQLVIPHSRLNAAIFIYHFSVASFAVSMLANPFTAMILAHEEMEIYALVSTVEVLLRLGLIFLLVVLQGDKLEIYASLSFSLSSLVAVAYSLIARVRYTETKFRFTHLNLPTFKEILKFTGWSFFGSLSTVFRTQAVTVLVNQYFSVIVVAAWAVANNVASQIGLFSSNFGTSLYPPIIKSYASGDRKRMTALVHNGAKITFFLVWVFALPLYLEMDYILSIWLVAVPPQASLFSRLALIEAVIAAISIPLATVARAPGKMLWYELPLGLIQLGSFPISLFLLRQGAVVETVYLVSIGTTVLMLLTRLIIVDRLVGLSSMKFFKAVIIPVVAIALSSGSVGGLASSFVPSGFWAASFVVVVSILATSLSMYTFGLDLHWKRKLMQILITRVPSFRRGQ